MCSFLVGARWGERNESRRSLGAVQDKIGGPSILGHFVMRENNVGQARGRFYFSFSI
jgi:hypothetical protein